MNVHFLFGKLHKDVVMLLPAISGWLASPGVYVFSLSYRLEHCLLFSALTMTSHIHIHTSAFLHLCDNFVFVFTKPENIAFQKSRVKSTLRRYSCDPTYKSSGFPPKNPCYGHFFCDVAYLYIFSAFNILTARHWISTQSRLPNRYSVIFALVLLFSLQLLWFI